MRCFILGDLASGMPLFGSRSVVTTAFGDVWNLGTVLFLIFESEVRASRNQRQNNRNLFGAERKGAQDRNGINGGSP